MPGVVSVQPRVQGGLLGQLGQVAGIARDVYGIKHESDMADLAQQQADRQQQLFDQAQEGSLPQSEKVAAARYGSFSDQPGKDSVLLNFVGDQNPTYYTPYKDSALVRSVDENGSPIMTYISRGDTVPAYNPPEKPQKTFTPTVLDNGNLGAFDSSTGHVVDTGLGAGAKPGKAVDPDKQAKVYTDMVKDIEKPRGNQSVQQAQVALGNIGKAQELINQYPDPNQMPSQQYSLLVGELGKIAAGGVASEHTQKSLEANTLAQKWNQLMSQTGNQPQGAQLGAFIQQNAQYLDGLKKANQQVVNDYAQKIYNGYADRLSDDQKARFQADYADLFKGKGGGAAASPVAQGGGGFVGTANAASGGGAHPQDAQALQWANQNLLSPDPAKATMARQILQLNGGK